MTRFLLGLALGAASGGVTYWSTHDGGLSALVGGAAAVLTWLGIAALIFVFDLGD